MNAVDAGRCAVRGFPRAHAALAQYFRSEAREAGAGLLAERFLESVERHTLASRNTAAAFLKEMLKYDIVRSGAGSSGRC